MGPVVKSYGPLMDEKSAAVFESYLQQIVKPGDYTRRGAVDNWFFDLAVAPSPTVDIELQNMTTMSNPVCSEILAKGVDTTDELGHPMQYRNHTLVNVWDSSLPEGQRFAEQRNKPKSTSVFDIEWGWSVFK